MESLINNIPAALWEKIQTRIARYKAMGISITIQEDSNAKKPALLAIIRQDIRANDSVLTREDLLHRGIEVLEAAEEYVRIHYRPVPFQGAEIENVSASWVLAKMAKHNLKQKDLVDALNVDRHVISKLLHNEFAFTRWHKAAFYYFIRSIEQRSKG